MAKATDWWTDNWDLVRGCSPVGAACKFCWLKAMMARFDHLGDFDVVRTLPHKLGIPLRARKPRIYATTLMGDLFHKDVPPDFILSVFKVMAGAPKKHRFVLLTKRWKQAAGHFVIASKMGYRSDDRVLLMGSAWDQESVNEAVESLRAVEEVNGRWGLHLEPLLGRVDLQAIDALGYWKWSRSENYQQWFPNPSSRLSWVVAGGENGKGTRTIHPHWVDSLRRQCRAARVPLWFKGWGWTGRYCPGCQEFLFDPKPHLGEACGTCHHRVEYRNYHKATGYKLPDAEMQLETPWQS